MQKKHLFYFGAMALALLIAGSVSAAVPGPGGFAPGNRPMGAPGQRIAQGPIISGAVTAISGTTITLSGRQGFGPNASATTTYAVDAGAAAFNKFAQGTNGRPTSTAITIADIQVGDEITVRGSVSGTDVTAKQITDGQIGGGPIAFRSNAGPGGNRPNGANPNGRPATSTPRNGNFNNHFTGTITSIDNTTITITGRMPGGNNQTAGTSYAVDAANAKITSGFGANLQTLAIADLSVGDQIEASGTISGTTITATAITKIAKPAAPSAAPQMRKPANQTLNSTATSSKTAELKKFLSQILNRFKNMFHGLFNR